MLLQQGTQLAHAERACQPDASVGLEGCLPVNVGAMHGGACYRSNIGQSRCAVTSVMLGCRQTHNQQGALLTLCLRLDPGRGRHWEQHWDQIVPCHAPSPCVLAPSAAAAASAASRLARRSAALMT